MADEPIINDDESLDESAQDNINEVKINGREVNPLLPSAEAYETQSADIDNLINELKLELKLEFQDKLTELQYLLTERERELRIKELELQQKEAQLQALQERLAKIEEVNRIRDEQAQQAQLPLISPPADLTGLSVDDIGLTQEEIDLIQSHRLGNNPQGIGGMPGAKRSQSIVIQKGVYQGDKYQLDDGTDLIWDDQKKTYELVGINQGLKYTFFAVEGAYLNDNYINPNYPQFYSASILGKQVWYERTPKGRKSDGIGEQYQGRVPMNVLQAKLTSSLNPAFIDPNTGELIENQLYEQAYKNWRHRWEYGTFYKNADGDLYSIVEKSIDDSKGNPPTYRTEGHLASPKYGQQVPVSSDEKSKWKGSLSGKLRR